MKATIEIKTLGDCLRRHLFERRVTMREAAKEIGCSCATVSRIASGENFALRWIIPIAKWCGLSAEELYELLEGEVSRW